MIKTKKQTVTLEGPDKLTKSKFRETGYILFVNKSDESSYFHPGFDIDNKFEIPPDGSMPFNKVLENTPFWLSGTQDKKVEIWYADKSWLPIDKYLRSMPLKKPGSAVYGQEQSTGTPPTYELDFYTDHGRYCQSLYLWAEEDIYVWVWMESGTDYDEKFKLKANQSFNSDRRSIKQVKVQNADGSSSFHLSLTAV